MISFSVSSTQGARKLLRLKLRNSPGVGEGRGGINKQSKEGFLRIRLRLKGDTNGNFAGRGHTNQHFSRET